MIGIVGWGIVGKAVGLGLKQKGHEIQWNDPAFENSVSLSDLVENCRVIFICVPTPSHPSGGCDLSTVYEVHSELLQAWFLKKKATNIMEAPIIVIKSTVIPGTCETLLKGYPFTCSNPEFLRTDSAKEDFGKRILIGTHKQEIRDVMKELYDDFDAPITFTTPTIAETVKYMTNAYLVSKVAFSQEVAKICGLLRVDADSIMIEVCLDPRIHPSHLKPSPGPIPFDNACLPKDLRGLIQQVEMSGYDPLLLKEIYRRGVESELKERLVKVLGEYLPLGESLRIEHLANEIMEMIE